MSQGATAQRANAQTVKAQCLDELETDINEINAASQQRLKIQLVQLVAVKTATSVSGNTFICSSKAKCPLIR